MAATDAVEGAEDEHYLLQLGLEEAEVVVVFASYYLLLKFWYCNYSVSYNGNSS